MKSMRFSHIIILAAVFLSGCLPSTAPQKPTGAMAYFAPQELKPSDFAKEIGKLVVITQDQKISTMEKAEAHRQLSILHLSPRNPDNNFQSAIDELGKFLELTPNQLDQSAAASWAIALKSGAEYREMKEQHQKLKNKIDKLEGKNYRLSKEKKALNTANAELKKTIEKLKNLDLSLEKKRRNFR